MDPVPILTISGNGSRCSSGTNCLRDSTCARPDKTGQLLRLTVHRPSPSPKQEDVVLWSGPLQEVWEQGIVSIQYIWCYLHWSCSWPRYANASIVYLATMDTHSRSSSLGVRHLSPVSVWADLLSQISHNGYALTLCLQSPSTSLTRRVTLLENPLAYGMGSWQWWGDWWVWLGSPGVKGTTKSFKRPLVE